MAGKSEAFSGRGRAERFCGDRCAHRPPFYRCNAQDSSIPHFRIAVDFFFMLSGFVIAHACEEKLRCGMRFAEFAWRRLVRLYPFVIAQSVRPYELALRRCSGRSQASCVRRERGWQRVNRNARGNITPAVLYCGGIGSIPQITAICGTFFGI